MWEEFVCEYGYFWYLLFLEFVGYVKVGVGVVYVVVVDLGCCFGVYFLVWCNVIGCIEL